jgi:hypothetical protein
VTGLFLARCAFYDLDAPPPSTSPMTSRQVWDEYEIDGRQLAAMVAAGEITRDGAVYHGVQAAVAARRAA